MKLLNKLFQILLIIAIQVMNSCHNKNSEYDNCIFLGIYNDFTLGSSFTTVNNLTQNNLEFVSCTAYDNLTGYALYKSCFVNRKEIRITTYFYFNKNEELTMCDFFIDFMFKEENLFATISEYYTNKYCNCYPGFSTIDYKDETCFSSLNSIKSELCFKKDSIEKMNRIIYSVSLQ